MAGPYVGLRRSWRVKELEDAPGTEEYSRQLPQFQQPFHLLLPLFTRLILRWAVSSAQSSISEVPSQKLATIDGEGV